MTVPSMDTLLEEMHGACWFTKSDLAHGYHQVHMRKVRLVEDQLPIPAGAVREFEWKVMPFCIHGSSSILMRIMNDAKL